MKSLGQSRIRKSKIYGAKVILNSRKSNYYHDEIVVVFPANWRKILSISRKWLLMTNSR